VLRVNDVDVAVRQTRRQVLRQRVPEAFVLRDVAQDRPRGGLPAELRDADPFVRAFEDAAARPGVDLDDLYVMTPRE
jgi:hypothetical protein